MIMAPFIWSHEERGGGGGGGVTRYVFPQGCAKYFEGLNFPILFFCLDDYIIYFFNSKQIFKFSFWVELGELQQFIFKNIKQILTFWV